MQIILETFFFPTGSLLTKKFWSFVKQIYQRKVTTIELESFQCEITVRELELLVKYEILHLFSEKNYS